MNTKQIYGKLLMLLSRAAGPDAAKKFDTRLRFHRSLNLKNPASLADKLSYIELHSQSPLAPMCTDKYAVREYIKSKGLEDILIPLAGGPWESVDDVDFDALPKSFVLKATHGCKMNYIVPDKSQLNGDECRKEMQRWLSTTYGSYSMEPHYLEIPHRIYAEEFLADGDMLPDYKIHCANGKPLFILAVHERKADGDMAMSLKLDLFDPEWNPIPGLIAHKKEVPGDGSFPRPRCLDKMLEAAKILSQDFDFVRVDLYERNNQVLFGELTFSPACCVFPYFPQSFLDEMGRHLTITDKRG